MPVITINGMIGSNAFAVGQEVARLMGLEYVDRLILAEAGKRVGAHPSVLEEKEQRPPGRGERLARLLQRALERSAMAGGAGDPFLGPGMDALLRVPYPEGSHEAEDQPQEIDDRRFVQVISEVVRDLAKGGNVVIIGRASNLVLRDQPGSLHVGLVAPLEKRLAVIMERERMDRATAERHVQAQDRARTAYFRRFFRAHPDDPSLYHLVLNMERRTPLQAAELISKATAIFAV